jgi:hypothetical protein
VPPYTQYSNATYPEDANEPQMNIQQNHGSFQPSDSTLVARLENSSDPNSNSAPVRLRRTNLRDPSSLSTVNPVPPPVYNNTIPTVENQPRATLLERMGGGAKDTNEARTKTPPLGRSQTPVQDQTANETSGDVRGSAGRRGGKRRRGQGLR